MRPPSRGTTILDICMQRFTYTCTLKGYNNNNNDFHNACRKNEFPILRPCVVKDVN